MSSKLLNVITYSNSEYKVNQNNGKGGSIYHQTFPNRKFKNFEESGFNFAIAIHLQLPSEINNLQKFKVELFQNNILIGESFKNYNQEITPNKVKNGLILSWHQGVATPNASEGLVEFRISMITQNESIPIEGYSYFHLSVGNLISHNLFIAFILNILCKIAPKFKEYQFNKNNTQFNT